MVAERIVHFLTRRRLDTIRSVDTLIWALIWINVVGLGPFAGALAIASSDLAALAKLMSEAIETADGGPVEGVLASGGGRLAVIRFGMLPQVLPIFAGQALYFFESNTRSATIIGIVGARRHRAVSLREDPRAGMARGGVPDPDGAGRRRGDRCNFQPVARGDHGRAARLTGLGFIAARRTCHDGAP